MFTVLRSNWLWSKQANFKILASTKYTALTCVTKCVGTICKKSTANVQNSLIWIWSEATRRVRLLQCGQIVLIIHHWNDYFNMNTSYFGNFKIRIPEKIDEFLIKHVTKNAWWCIFYALACVSQGEILENTRVFRLITFLQNV